MLSLLGKDRVCPPLYYLLSPLTFPLPLRLLPHLYCDQQLHSLSSSLGHHNTWLVYVLLFPLSFPSLISPCSSSVSPAYICSCSCSSLSSCFTPPLLSYLFQQYNSCIKLVLFSSHTCLLSPYFLLLLSLFYPQELTAVLQMP